MVKQLIAQHELEVPEGVKIEVKGRRVRVTGPRGAWALPAISLCRPGMHGARGQHWRQQPAQHPAYSRCHLMPGGQARRGIPVAELSAAFTAAEFTSPDRRHSSHPLPTGEVPASPPFAAQGAAAAGSTRARSSDSQGLHNYSQATGRNPSVAGTGSGYACRLMR